MRLFLVVLCLCKALSAAQAATVPQGDFTLSVSWETENEVTYNFDVETGERTFAGNYLFRNTFDSGLSVSTKDPSSGYIPPYVPRNIESGVSITGTEMKWFYYFSDLIIGMTYDFATGKGLLWETDQQTSFAARWTFDTKSGNGTYYYSNDEFPYVQTSLADLMNVNVSVIPSPVPIAPALPLAATVLGLLFGLRRLKGRV